MMWIREARGARQIFGPALPCLAPYPNWVSWLNAQLKTPPSTPRLEEPPPLPRRASTIATYRSLCSLVTVDEGDEPTFRSLAVC